MPSPPPPPAPAHSSNQCLAVPPESYRRDPDSCHKFVLACELYLEEFPGMTLSQKMSFVIRCLTERAHDWAIAIWSEHKRLISEELEGSQLPDCPCYLAGSAPPGCKV